MKLEDSIDAIIRTSAFRRNVYDMIPAGASRILDIGCGDGGLLLRLLRDKNCSEVSGVEINPGITTVLSQVAEKVWHTDIEKDTALFAEGQGRFDYILMHDVVEHLVDPWHTLMKIRSLGSANCRYIIATPNLHHWRFQHEIMSGRFHYGPGLWHTGHLRWFTPASLMELLLVAGLRVKPLYLDISEEISFEALRSQGEVRRVQFPPPEYQQGVEPERIYAVEYGRCIKEYVPVFYASKLIAQCGKGDLIIEPQPMTNNCPLLEALRKALALPFDIYNPPQMRLLVGTSR